MSGKTWGTLHPKKFSSAILIRDVAKRDNEQNVKGGTSRGVPSNPVKSGFTFLIFAIYCNLSEMNKRIHPVVFLWMKVIL